VRRSATLGAADRRITGLTRHAKEHAMGLEIGALRRAGTLGKRATGAIRTASTTNPGARRTRTSECVEAVAGVLLVTAIGLALPGHWGLLDVQPHPYWLVVLAIGVRYGLPAGYVAGGLSAASYLALSWFAPRERATPFGAHDLLQPLLLLAGAVVIGEIAEARRRRLVEAERVGAETSAALDEALTRYRATLEVKSELEKRIVGQPASVMTLYETAKQLETLDRARLYPAILNLLTTVVGVEACALYVRNPDGFRLHSALPASGAQRALTLDTSEGVIAQSIRERRLVTVRDRLRADGPAGLADEPALMAGPLLDHAGELSGLVVVEKLPFLKFSPTSVRLCNLILDWASTALQNATLYEDTLVRAVDHDLTGAFTPQHTLKVLRDELLRARRYGLPFAVVVIQAQGLAEASGARHDDLLRALGQAFRACLRSVDIIGHHAEPDTFVLALPVTPLEGARVIAERVADELRMQGLSALSLRIGLTSYAGETTRSEVFDSGSGAFLQRAAPALDTPDNAAPLLEPAPRDPARPATTPAWGRALPSGCGSGRR
jgi:GGDEF domain-containing protein